MCPEGAVVLPMMARNRSSVSLGGTAPLLDHPPLVVQVDTEARAEHAARPTPRGQGRRSREVGDDLLHVPLPTQGVVSPLLGGEDRQVLGERSPLGVRKHPEVVVPGRRHVAQTPSVPTSPRCPSSLPDRCRSVVKRGHQVFPGTASDSWRVGDLERTRPAGWTTPAETDLAPDGPRSPVCWCGHRGEGE